MKIHKIEFVFDEERILTVEDNTLINDKPLSEYQPKDFDNINSTYRITYENEITIIINAIKLSFIRIVSDKYKSNDPTILETYTF